MFNGRTGTFAETDDDMRRTAAPGAVEVVDPGIPRAAADGDVDGLKVRLPEGAGPEAADAAGRPPLRRAAQAQAS